MDYKRKISNVAETDILLPDWLNTFFARFEDNTVPPTRPAPTDWGISFSVADMNKTFKCVNPRKAAETEKQLLPQGHQTVKKPSLAH